MELVDNYDQKKNATRILDELRNSGVNPYPEKFDKQATLAQVRELESGTPVATAGRIVLLRTMGKLTFAHIQDFSGRMQIVVKEDSLGKEKYTRFLKVFGLGDHVGCKGKIFITKVGEKSILVDELVFLAKSFLKMPEKWVGIKDQEVKYRQRYLDLIAHPDTMKAFIFRSDLIRHIREFYWKNDFFEVETPALMHQATGAIARPYITKNNALDIDLFLRISHELPLKELIVGGFDRVFELGKAFRNEGVDVSHLPEHTHLEHYVAYWNYEDNMDFTEKMFRYLFEELHIPERISTEDGGSISLGFPWRRENFIDLVEKETGIRVGDFHEADALRLEIKNKKFHFEGIDTLSLAGLVDNLYKKIVRPRLINPTFLYYYPIELQPLARRNDTDPNIADQFQLVINGWEIVKAYSELVDPLDQEQRFMGQADAKKKGADEVMEIDRDYIKAMSYGMPPISGFGMGVDRLVALLLGKSNLRDVVLFPLLRPEGD